MHILPISGLQVNTFVHSKLPVHRHQVAEKAQTKREREEEEMRIHEGMEQKRQAALKELEVGWEAGKWR